MFAELRATIEHRRILAAREQPSAVKLDGR
jgi:hypothetical protein